MAQRAAAEAVLVGRETLETSVAQGEQLNRAQNVADETEYMLDRAGRLLRGMTWSGWLANKFTKDIEPPEYEPTSCTMAKKEAIPMVYEHVPEACQDAAQAVQNYHANLQVLETCETEEQKETLIVICNSMYDQSLKELKSLSRQDVMDTAKNKFVSRLSRDLAVLRDKQLATQKVPRGVLNTPIATMTSTVATDPNPSDSKAILFRNATPKKQVVPVPDESDVVAMQQESHLENIGMHLRELNSIAYNLNQSITDQKDVLETLDSKQDSMLFKSKMVTRRADRLVQKKSWVKSKPEFQYHCSIRHVKSGKFLAVSANNGVILSEKFNETCIFGLWKKQGSIFGLQSKYSKRWMGQALLGGLSCSSYYFDRREEWDADESYSETPILCASAGWGNGGYLLVQEDETIVIGAGGLADKKQADAWCIAPRNNELSSPPKASTSFK